MSTSQTIRPEAEQAILGSMLVERRATKLARMYLEVTDFYYERHQELFRVFCEVADDCSQGYPDMFLVADRLREKGLFDDLGGADYLADLVDGCYSASQSEYYAKAVKAAALDRRVGSYLEQAKEEHTSEALPTRETMSKLTDLLMERRGLKAEVLFDSERDMHEVVASLLDGKEADLIYTGFRELDEVTSLAAGDLATVAAVPSGGKTACMLAMAHHIAQKRKVLFLTTEMLAMQLVYRLLPAMTGVPFWKFRKKRFRPEDHPLIVTGAAKLAELHLAISGRPSLDLGDIEAAVVQAHPDVVFVDYLQRCDYPNPRDPITYRIGAFMRGLKNMSLDLGVRTVIGCQLSRAVHKAADTPPSLADLSDSSFIEKESDLVLAMWRPATITGLDPSPGCVPLEMIKLKDRNGPAFVSFPFQLHEDLVQVCERGALAGPLAIEYQQQEERYP